MGCDGHASHPTYTIRKVRGHAWLEEFACIHTCRLREKHAKQPADLSRLLSGDSRTGARGRHAARWCGVSAVVHTAHCPASLRCVRFAADEPSGCALQPGCLLYDAL